MFVYYAEGGIKFPNIQSMVDTQLVKWIQRYFCSSDQKWTRLFLDHILIKFGGKILFVINYTTSFLIKIEDIPISHINLLKAWSKSDIHYDIVDDKSQASILEQCVWNNQFIAADSKTLYCKPLHEAGLCIIFHLFNVNGEIIKFEFWKAKGVSNKYYL